MGGGTTSSTTEKKADPWEPAQPYLKEIMAQGQSLYGSGAGTRLWGGPTLADQDPNTLTSAGMIGDTARNSAALSSMPAGYGAYMMGNDGLSSGMSSGLGTLGGISGITGGGKNYGMDVLSNMAGGGSDVQTDRLAQLYSMSKGPTAADKYLTGMAAGGANVNPFLQSMADTNADRIANRTSSLASGMGRYGSGAHTDVMARSIAEANNPMFAAAYEADQNRKLQAAGMIDSSRLGYSNLGMGAAQGIAGINRGNVDTRMGAATGMTDRQMSAANSQLGVMGQGLDRTGQWAGMMPALNDLMYDPAKRFAGLGAVQESRAQANLDAERAKFDQGEQMPWSQLNKYLGSVSGLGGILNNAGAGTSTTTSTGPGMSPMSFIGPAISLLGLFSDERVKKDIEKFPDVIDARTGAPMSFWRYKGTSSDSPLMAGPMAQDVLKTRPDLVMDVGGILAIKR